MFEKASRLKVRFATDKGMLMAEDLWDLPLTGRAVNLDKIAIDLSRQLKEETTESFVVAAKKTSEELQLKFDLVKHVIDVRLAENAAAKGRADAAAKKERILEIISRKQDKQLEETSLEDLQQMVSNL